MTKTDDKTWVVPTESKSERMRRRHASIDFWLKRLAWIAGALAVIVLLTILIRAIALGTHHNGIMNDECTAKGGGMVYINGGDVCMKPGEVVELETPEWVA